MLRGHWRKRRFRRLLGLAFAAVFASVPGVASAMGSDSGGGSQTTCTGAFSGTAYDLVVPSGSTCLVSGAFIKHDVIVQTGGGLAIERSVVGDDISASRPQNVETGFGASLNPGPVRVGHDLTISGSDAPNAVGYDICDTTVGNDLVVDRTAPQFEIDIGDEGPQDNEFCTYAQEAPDRVGHDLVVDRNSPLNIDVGNNSVGHDLIVADNTAKTNIDVSDNRVGETAFCSGNTPPPSPDGPEDGPNKAEHKYGCW